MRKVRVDEAVGLELGYDITKIVPKAEKYRAYRRGQIITAEDIPILKDMGKQYIYVFEPDDNLVHEDDAAVTVAQIVAGEGLSITEPSTGRVNIIADYDGLLKVNVELLDKLNYERDIVLATLHNNRNVQKGQTVAGTRVVPIAVPRELIDKIGQLTAEALPMLTLKPLLPLKVAVVTTGSEVFSGRIKDGFLDVILQKIAPFKGELLGQTLVSDEHKSITKEIDNFLEKGAEIVFVTGGMSVDADDVTPQGIRDTGAEVVFYGAPILPGSQFMLAYKNGIPICGVPGGALFSRKTTLDILLPRLFANDRIKYSDIVAMGHGGLCEDCKVCHFPVCPYGKATY